MNYGPIIQFVLTFKFIVMLVTSRFQLQWQRKWQKTSKYLEDKCTCYGFYTVHTLTEINIVILEYVFH